MLLPGDLQSENRVTGTLVVVCRRRGRGPSRRARWLPVWWSLSRASATTATRRRRCFKVLRFLRALSHRRYTRKHRRLHGRFYSDCLSLCLIIIVIVISCLSRLVKCRYTIASRTKFSQPRYDLDSPMWGRGTPLPPLSIYFFIFSPFLLFSFFHWLYLFSSFVLPFPFYQNSPTPFPGRRS